MRSIVGQILDELRRLGRTAAMVGIGLLLLAMASLFTADPAATFFRILSLVGSVLIVVSVLMMVLTLRKAGEIRPGALLVSLVVALVTLAIQLAAGRSLPPWTTTVLAFAAGGSIGIGWSRTRLVFIDGGIVRSRGTAWYLVVWVAIFAFNQLTTTLAGGVPTAMTAALLVGTGIVLGTSLEQITRCFVARRLIDAARAGGEVAP